MNKQFKVLAIVALLIGSGFNSVKANFFSDNLGRIASDLAVVAATAYVTHQYRGETKEKVDTFVKEKATNMANVTYTEPKNLLKSLWKTFTENKRAIFTVATYGLLGGLAYKRSLSN